MSTVVERSPADAGSIEDWMFELIKVVNWLSPTDNLIASQWNELNVLGSLSWLHLFGPLALTLALLDVAVLDEGIFGILVKYLVSKDTVTGRQFTILHDLVVNVFGIDLVNFLPLDSLFALIDVDVAVALMYLVVQSQDFLCSFHLHSSCLAVDLLLPESDLLIVV